MNPKQTILSKFLLWYIYHSLPNLYFHLNSSLSDLEGFPCGSDGHESAYNPGDPSSIPGWRRFPGEWNGNPFQYSCLENSMDRGSRWATIHGTVKSQTRLSKRAHTQCINRQFFEVNLTQRFMTTVARWSPLLSFQLDAIGLLKSRNWTVES